MKKFLILLGSQLVRALFEDQTTLCCSGTNPRLYKHESIQILSRGQGNQCTKVKVSDKRGCFRINMLNCNTYTEASSNEQLNQESASKVRDVTNGSAHEYLSYESMKQQLKELNKFEFGYFIESIGKTYENRDIFAFKISSGSQPNKKAIWINGGFHANQWISPAVIISSIEKLLKSANDGSERFLLDHFDFYFTPLANPDGYEYSRSNYCTSVWIYNRVQNRDYSRGASLESNWQRYIRSKYTDQNFNRDKSSSIFQLEVKALGEFEDSIQNKHVSLHVVSDGPKIIRDQDWLRKTPQNNRVIDNIATSMLKNSSSFNYNANYQAAKENESEDNSLVNRMLPKQKSISYVYSLPLKSESSNSRDAKYYIVQPNEQEYQKYASDFYSSLKALANYLRENDSQFSALF